MFSPDEEQALIPAVDLKAMAALKTAMPARVQVRDLAAIKAMNRLLNGPGLRGLLHCTAAPLPTVAGLQR